MRLNTKKLQEIMVQKNLTEEVICTRTGLDKHSVRWIFDNGFVSEDAMERIASVAGVKVGDILLPEITGNVENTIEFTTGSKRATVAFSQGRYKTRIKQLAKGHPEECEIIAENQDGSLCAHIPVKWIRINPGNEISAEHKDKLRENLRKAQYALRDNGLNSIEKPLA